MNKERIQNQPLGQLVYRSEKYDITESELAIEEIDGQKLIYLSAIVSHYEIHGNSNVYVQDVRLNLLMPYHSNILSGNTRFHFPKSDSNHPNWERSVYSVFYHFEHLLITECEVEIKKLQDHYQVLLTGKTGESLASDHGRNDFIAIFLAYLTEKIDRRTNYFL